MAVKKISIAITQELNGAIEGVMIEKEMSRSRVIETLLRENPLIRRNIKQAASEPRGVLVAPSAEHRLWLRQQKHKHPQVPALTD
jgi:metal-responsive CopG/Arc/MetJ family transcriptional regulator